MGKSTFDSVGLGFFEVRDLGGRKGRRVGWRWYSLYAFCILEGFKSRQDEKRLSCPCYELEYRPPFFSRNFQGLLDFE